MRTLATLSLLAIAGAAAACPWWGRCCPRPVYYYPPCPPPVVRVVEAPPPVPEKKPDVAKDDGAPAGWCHIRGRVVYDGNQVPEQKLIPKSGGAYTEDWVVNVNNRGVKNVVVWLVPELSDEQVKALEARRLRDVPSFQLDRIYPGLSWKGSYLIVHERAVRAYSPHVQVLQAGSDQAVVNGSDAPANAKWESRANGEFNILQPPGRLNRFENLKAERLPIMVSSSLHPWMRAYVWILDHPYFAVTDQDGNFEIKFAPKGNLRLVVWQEAMGFRGGREGRWGEAIKAPGGRLDLGEIKIKPPGK